MNQAADWLALTGIIATALVSILSVFVPVWLEHKRMDREDARRAEERLLAELDAMNRGALDFLNVLSFFKATTTDELNSALTKSEIAINVNQAISVLQSRFYGWETGVWARLNAQDKTRIRELRKRIEKEYTPRLAATHQQNPYASQVAEIADEVLSITRAATGRE